MATVPKQLATPEDTFTALALQFNFEQRIKDKIIELGIRTIAEFRHYARSEDEIKKLFIDTVKDPPYEEMQGRLQAARLRFAWTACKALLDSEHAAASLPPAPTEEETLLPKQELEQLKEAFFRRYHLRPEPRQYPSDRLLSKLSRQLTRSQFEVMDLWTVRSLTFQRTHSQKRRRLTGNLYLQEDDEDEITAKSWLSYMAKMDTYFLALAIVGCRPVEPAPSAPESLGADSVQYVQVPYDILLSYSSRCHDLILRTSEGRRLQLVQHLDVEERGQWAARCTGHTTLGNVISAIMRERDALWLAGALPAPSITTGTAAGGASPAKAPPADAGPVGSVVSTLRDGTQLCQAYQRNQCRTKKNCPRGAHRCGVVLQSGRVCGSYQHSPSGCPKAA